MNKEQSIEEALELIEKREKNLSFQKPASIIIFIIGIALLASYIYAFSKVGDLVDVSQKFNDMVTHEQHSLLLEIVDSKIQLALAGHKIKNSYMPLFIGCCLGWSIATFFTLKAKRRELDTIKSVLHAIKQNS
jgi:hypothetical protein